MSEKINVTAPVDPDELRKWAEKHADAGQHSVAHVLYAAGNLYAGMTPEYRVEYEELHTTKYVPPHGPPWSRGGDRYVRCDPYWKSHETGWNSKDEAERLAGIYSEESTSYPKYRNPRIIVRYVTVPEVDGE